MGGAGKFKTEESSSTEMEMPFFSKWLQMGKTTLDLIKVEQMEENCSMLVSWESIVCNQDLGGRNV